MAAPIRTDVAIRLKAMRDLVVDLGFIWIALTARSADTLGDHHRVAFLVT